jgi:hypothetical protein
MVDMVKWDVINKERVSKLHAIRFFINNHNIEPEKVYFGIEAMSITV